jgi:hypothetical protein
MEPESRKRWEQTRSIGFARFVLIFGVLMWGMTMTVVFLLAVEWLTNLLFGAHSLRVTGFALVGTLVGLLSGISIWFIMEQKYRKDEDNKHPGE